MDITQSDDEPIEEVARYNAELVIERMKSDLGVSLAYDEASVAWLDGYIERSRSTLAQNTIDRLINILGSFLGECIRQKYGGKWAEHGGHYAIEFDDYNAVFPFSKVAKQFENGQEGSIVSLFTTIPLVFKLDRRSYEKEIGG